ncbi:MAG TPA: hypothetical protein VF212_10980 [Longimicrobiales bacterium]
MTARSRTTERDSHRRRHAARHGCAPPARARTPRIARPRAALAGSLAVALLPLLLGCGADAPVGGAPAVVVRDSAGIRIIENAAALWRPGAAWRVAPEPSLEILPMGSNDGAVLLDPASVYRARDGRWIVADGRFAGWHKVFVFDSLGRFLAEYGREGQGPCEFRQLWWARPYRGDSIAAHDYSADKISIFDADGRCGREVRLPTWVPPRAPGTWGYADGAWTVYDDGAFLTYPGGYLDIEDGPGIAWYRHALLRVAPDGESWDSLGVFGILQARWTGREQRELPYAAIAVHAVRANDLLYGTGERFELLRYDPHGRLVEIVRRPWEPRPVTDAHRERFRAWYRARAVAASRTHGGAAGVERAMRRLDALDYPDHLPAYDRLVVDALGHAWLRHHPGTLTPDATDPATTPWSIFTPDGRWLGELSLPTPFTPDDIGADYVAGIWEDADAVRWIRVYALTRAPTT